MKEHYNTNHDCDPAFLNPEIYGQLAKIFCLYPVFCTCKKLISDYIEGRTDAVSEEIEEANVVHFFTDLYVENIKLGKKESIDGLHWMAANVAINKEYESCEIDEAGISPYNVIQLLLYINFTYVELSRGEDPPVEESNDMAFLRKELLTRVCLSTLNHFIPEYAEADYNVVNGIIKV